MSKPTRKKFLNTLRNPYEQQIREGIRELRSKLKPYGWTIHSRKVVTFKQPKLVVNAYYPLEPMPLMIFEHYELPKSTTYKDFDRDRHIEEYKILNETISGIFEFRDLDHPIFFNLPLIDTEKTRIQFEIWLN